MSDHHLHVEIDDNAGLLDVEFLNGPRIPSLTRSQAYALLTILQEAIPKMPFDLNTAGQPTAKPA